jgi:WD40 repeat protein
VSASSDKTIRVWNPGTGELLRTLSGHDDSVWSVAFSPDGGRIVATGGSNIPSRQVRIWDAASGAEIRILRGHTNGVFTGAWSPDGKRVVTGSADTTLKIWNAETGALLRTLAGATDQIRSAAMSRDVRRVVAGSEGGFIMIWDGESGALLRGLKQGEPVKSVALSPDGRLAAVGIQAAGANLKIWKTESGRELRTFSGHSDTVFSVAFSPDGRRLASGSADRTLRIWDTATGTQLASLSGHEGPITSLAFSPDGGRVVTGSWDTTLKVWDVSSPRPGEYRELRGLQGHSASVYRVAYSPDGRLILSTSRDQTLRVWDAAAGPLLRTLTGHNSMVQSAAFSPDSRYIVSGSSNNDLKIWEAESGRLVRTITGLLGSAVSLNYTPDGRRILVGALDGTVRFFDAAEGKEIAQFVGFTDGEWVSITPDGYYTASAKGDGRINVLTGSTVYGIDAYRSTFYRPPVVEARLKGLSDPLPAAAAGIQKAASFEPPIVLIRSPESGGSLDAARTELSVLVVDQRQPIKSLKVLVNGRAVGSDDLKSLEGSRGLTVVAAGLAVTGNQNRVEVRFPLSLERGLNRIEVIAANPYSEGRDVVELTVQGRTGGNPLPNLWILAIGINRYDDPGIPNLSYAAADAREIIGAFKAQEGKLYRRVESLLIADGSDVAPTRDNIIDNLGFLQQAGQRDVVMLFIAGHGVNDDGGNFFLLPSNAAFNPDGSIRQSRAIPNRDIRSILDLPGQKLVFIDACHSEGTSGKKTRAVENNGLVRELMDAGTVIFTSSRGSELSQEAKEYGHGVFTWAIIQGMQGQADLIKDGIITMKELDTYVSETVPRLTKGLQHPTTSTPEGYINFNVAELK